MIVLWLKAAHVAAVITWLGGQLGAGLLLMAVVNRPATEPMPPTHLLAAVWRWDRRVTAPAMGLAWVLGLAMATRSGWLAFNWLQLKLVLVVGLSALHGMQSGSLRRLVRGEAVRLPWPLRVAPFVLVAAVLLIVALVMLKPFG